MSVVRLFLIAFLAALDSGCASAASRQHATIPADQLAAAREAKEHFERGNYRDAEAIYERILAAAPNNLYILTNLGVVRFRSGKLKLAEAAFQQAIAIAPNDAFSHCTLGIVYYSQNRFDAALESLKRAIRLDPRNATAHNYLGMIYSQRGMQEEAIAELKTARELDPSYGESTEPIRILPNFRINEA
jgi:tetratricopeptide (TPR) repeat protein